MGETIGRFNSSRQARVSGDNVMVGNVCRWCAIYACEWSRNRNYLILAGGTVGVCSKYHFIIVGVDHGLYAIGVIHELNRLCDQMIFDDQAANWNCGKFNSRIGCSSESINVYLFVGDLSSTGPRLSNLARFSGDKIARQLPTSTFGWYKSGNSPQWDFEPRFFIFRLACVRYRDCLVNKTSCLLSDSQSESDGMTFDVKWQPLVGRR